MCRYACFAGLGSKSGLATGDLQEGDRDPVTGRLILDPLKIPTADQGAPGTWEEYLAMRKAKEGGVAKDMQVCYPWMGHYMLAVGVHFARPTGRCACDGP